MLNRSSILYIEDNADNQRLVRRIGATAVRGALRRQCSCPGIDSEPGVVLDPFLGAGSTALAAERLGRNWVGIELNPAYAALTVERLQQERAAKPVHAHPGRNHGPP